ncbi:outer membrane protein (porin) [Burkholderia sp. Ch1-1]|uniref:Outer membrane protein (Porin) n=1 Tax=Paraburkholderia dioscoreae TaxID=2604047 RepID=A0A5Q4ZFH4_9BURK|nr:porin [Paraburkholderia dioscoreae]EIF35693.1 outer membrane protein (porin) [Burkholderia sp. Ch1-1]VVD31613.1 Outer membrane protein (Porin) [Paraburkholderia dioscoreae]
MKKTTLALLTLPLLASAAHAQSSVTLYGFVDAGLVYVNNQSGHSNVQMVTGQTNGSRWGLRGSEDLGGGLKAIFTLENGFDPSNGKLLQNGREFGRQAFVGLSSDTWGAVTLGRQYDPMTELIGGIAATSMWAWLGTHPGDFDDLNSTFRVNNAVKYLSPTFYGLQASGMFAPGGVAGNFASSRIYTLGLKYENGPLSAALAYDNINNPSVSVLDSALSPGQAGYVTPGRSPVTSGYVSANVWQIFGAAASYRIGKGMVGIVYTNARFQDIRRTASTPNTGTAAFNSYEINGRYSITPALLIGASFDYTTARDAKYEQIDFGPNYSLSKRTDLNLVGVWQHASGVDSTGRPAVAAITTLGQSSTPTQVAVKLSLRHRF